MALTIDGTNGIETNTDTGKIKVGASDDLSIYHDGSHNILLCSNNADLKIKDADHNSAIFYTSAGVELFYDNVKKFETYSNGTLSTGNMKCTGSAYVGNQVDGDDTNSTGQLFFGASNDLKIYHNGSNSYITDSGTGALRINSNDARILNAAGTEDMIRCQENGSVELYYDNAKRFETDANGLKVHSASTAAEIEMRTSGEAYRGSVYVNSADYIGFLDHSGNWVIEAQRDTETEFHNTNIISNTDNSYNVGSSSKRWDNIYATNGTIQTSDRNEKNTIVDSDLGLSFVNKLKPVSYKFNGKTRTHYGLIAQDVETTLSDISKTTTDFAGFIKSDTPEIKWRDKEALPEGKSVGDVRYAAGTKYGLRYTEFISPLVKAIQELSLEVETLKTKVATLEAS